MLSTIALRNSAKTRKYMLPWQTITTYMIVSALFALATWMRLVDLGLPIDRDGYDEGVYWQSLRAMSAGHTLYQQIFYSQPPFFLFSLYPTYVAFGQTLWSARLGVVVISLLGLVGAFLLGKTLSGRLGAIAALLLLTLDPLYLKQSQTLQAEGLSAAFSLLAVAFAYLWWEQPISLGYAALVGALLSLSILCKLLAVTTLVPITFLAVAHIWRAFHRDPKTRWVAFRPLLIAMSTFVVVTAILLSPFLGSFPAMIQGVITFHVDAARLFQSSQPQNLLLIGRFIFSFATVPALYGTLVAIMRRDWRVLPLLAWFLTTLVLLWQQVPLFEHHFTALIPPLIALATMGINLPIPRKQRILTSTTPDLSRPRTGFPRKKPVAAALGILTILIAGAVGWQAEQAYYHIEQQKSTIMNTDTIIIKDLHSLMQPGQFVITDAPFLAGRADRSTPPSLVDTSFVRIDTGYLTQQQLTEAASQAQVQAILFHSQRLLSMKRIGLFYGWMTHHFRLVRRYGIGQELWVRVL